MAEHTADILWERQGDDFVNGRYRREHTWRFDGGLTVPASPSPSVVPPPYANPAHIDPEEALVAAISSCHMLVFLHLASKQGLQVDRYHDHAVGRMAKNDAGAWWVSRVTLNPTIAYSGDRQPTEAEEAQLHHQAHAECFIANSVKSEVVVA